MKNGVAIKYGDVALGAKENFKPSMGAIEPFSDISILQKNNISFKNYGNPIEKYSVLLDGSVLPFPSEIENEVFGIWSEEISGEDGFFKTPLVLSLKSTDFFTSSGIILVFDEPKNIHPVDVLVTWWRGNEKIAEEQFAPNSANYFFNKKVEYYDGLTFRFSKLNMPKNRLKIHSIEYGLGVLFYGDELKNVNLSQSIDPISTEIQINTCGFNLNSKRNIEYSFQNQQPVSIYFNENLLATTFVKSAKRIGKNVWNIQTEDYIGLMETISYQGGIYNNVNADELIADIFGVANIPFSLDERFIGMKLSGYIPYTTCRNALMQVCFAINAVIDTSNSDKVKIFGISNEISQQIEPQRVLQGQSSDEKSVVTAVELTAHFYKELEETKEVYNSEKSGIGENIFIKFNEPLYELSITNGKIISHGTNYAIINANENCVLSGKKYDHTTFTKTKRNPIVSQKDIENIVTISSATLVTKNNVDNLLDVCYNYIVNSQNLKSKIVEGKHIIYGEIIKYGEKKYGQFKYGEKNKNIVIYDKPIHLSDLITIPFEFSSSKTARVVKQTYNLNGGIIAKNVELR